MSTSSPAGSTVQMRRPQTRAREAVSEGPAESVSAILCLGRHLQNMEGHPADAPWPNARSKSVADIGTAVGVGKSGMKKVSQAYTHRDAHKPNEQSALCAIPHVSLSTADLF